MMASDFIIDVSEADFDYQVLTFSQERPVVVDFWAPWCAPCRVLGPVLERVVREFNGSFRLARVNVDENPNLSRRYHVRSIPAVKAFRDGKLFSEFSGALPEPKVREFVRTVAPGQNELLLEKGNSLLWMRQYRSAERIFRQILEEDPNSTAALLGLAKSHLLLGRAEEAMMILDHFPASREFTTAEMLHPLAEALRMTQANSLEDLEAAYYNALNLFKRGNLPASLDGFLEILRQDRRYRNGEARRVVVAILELLDPEDALSRQYRNELAATLF